MEIFAVAWHEVLGHKQTTKPEYKFPQLGKMHAKQFIAQNLNYSLMFVSTIFFQILFFHQMIVFQKPCKTFFHFIQKALFVIEKFKLL